MDIHRPGAERLNKPASPSAAIESELSLHPDSASFNEALDTYELSYIGSNFSESMAHYVTVLADAHEKLWMNPRSERPPSVDTAFYRGAMFGLHVSLEMLPNEFSDSVLDTNFGAAPPRLNQDEPIGNYYNRLHAVVLDQQDQVDRSIKSLPPKQREPLQAAANRAYPKSNERRQRKLDALHEQQFMSGTFYAIWIALHRPIE